MYRYPKLPIYWKSMLQAFTYYVQVLVKMHEKSLFSTWRKTLISWKFFNISLETFSLIFPSSFIWKNHYSEYYLSTVWKKNPLAIYPVVIFPLITSWVCHHSNEVRIFHSFHTHEKTRPCWFIQSFFSWIAAVLPSLPVDLAFIFIFSAAEFLKCSTFHSILFFLFFGVSN